jgi:hypothetical protein
MVAYQYSLRPVRNELDGITIGVASGYTPWAMRNEAGRA